jgi:predicted DNA-binding protein (MmcQ/YjbR family)
VLTGQDLRDACLALPAAREEFPFDDRHSVFKVGGKIFAICALDGDPLEISLKCDPEMAQQLRSSLPAVRPGYHLNKRHWNTVTIDGSIPDGVVRDMIDDSHALVVAGLPRSRRPTG